MLMKRISTLLFALTAMLTLPLTANAEDYVFDFQNNTLNLPVGEGASFTDGALTAPVTVGEVTLTSVQGDAVYPAIMMKDNKGVISLNVYKNGAIKLSAAEGKAVTKIAATMKSKTFGQMTASTGTTNENVWEGNATEVTFSASALMSIWKLEVTTAAENGETVKPVVVSYDVEAANIAAFNTTEDSKLVKLTLKDARVNGKKDSDYYVEDASGAVVIKGISLTVGTLLNGYIVGTKNTSDVDYVNDPSQALEYQLTATDASTFEATPTTLTGTVMTITDACTQANYGKLVTIENVTITGTGQNKTLTDANGNTMKARDYFAVLPDDYTWPENAKSITGVLIYYMTGWFLMPLSADAIKAAGVQPTSVTFTFDGSLHTVGTKIGDTAGYIYNETFTVDNVQLQLVSGSAQTRIYADANRGTCLTMYKEYATMTFRAPEGYAIQQIDFTAAGSSDIKSFTASSGTINGMTWTGNAEGVRFLNGATPYLANAIVTLAEKTAETVALEGLPYVACDNIAAFNALEAGSYAKVMLNDAEITGISADGISTAWIQDATGGCWIQFTSFMKDLKENNKVNGYVYVVKRFTSGNTQMKETEDTPSSEFTLSPIDGPTVIEGTLAEVNVPANLNKVVKISGASFVATSATEGTLTQGDAEITVKNGTATANQQLHKITDTWVKDETKLDNVTIVAILVAQSNTKNQLLPISMTTTATGIAKVNSDLANGKAAIYNLQGMRQTRLTKGLNIVNGQKVMVK